MRRMDKKDIVRIIQLVKKDVKRFENPIVTQVGELTKDPFAVLISCLLSLRTKDATTAIASKKLFKLAKTPKDMLKLSIAQIEKAIYPVGFYHTKAKRIKGICKVLLEKYDSKVPETIEELVELKGVGRKTAGIVMCYGHNKGVSIPVDSHVHQISNRLGIVKTKTPEKTEEALMKIIPKAYWRDFNDIFVNFGQHVCVPVSPFCSRCVIKGYCPRIGVKRSR